MQKVCPRERTNNIISLNTIVHKCTGLNIFWCKPFCVRSFSVFLVFITTVLQYIWTKFVCLHAAGLNNGPAQVKKCAIQHCDRFVNSLAHVQHKFVCLTRHK